MGLEIKPVDIDYNKIHFYEHMSTFKKFSELDEKRMEELDKIVAIIKEHIKKFRSNIQKYDMTLRTIIKTSSRQITNFDERAYVLMKVMDPDLNMYYSFLATPMACDYAIKNCDDEEEMDALLKEKRNGFLKLREQIRYKFGTFDSDLLKIEGDFFNKCFKDKKLLTKIGIDYSEQLLSYVKQVNKFDSISIEEFNSINEIAMNWLASMNGNENHRVAAFNALFQSNLLGLKSNEEKIIFFVLACDSELKALKIYNEVDRWDRIKERCIEEIGLGSINLIKAERMIAKKFMPDFDKDMELKKTSQQN